MAPGKSPSVMVVVLSFLAASLAAQGAQVTFTHAEQQVGGRVAAMLSESDRDHLIDEQFNPATPEGVGNADLKASVSGCGASGDADLVSVFGAGEVAVKGSTSAHTEWIGRPAGAMDVHVGDGSTFVLVFTTGDSATPFHLDGSVSVELIGEPGLHPEETFVDVKLSPEGGAVLWSTRLDGNGGTQEHEVSHERTLEPSTSYRLEVLTEAGTVASLNHPGPLSRRTHFDLHLLWPGGTEPNQPVVPAIPCDRELVGPWMGRLTSPGETLLHMFTFSPLCPGADEYLVTVQMTQRAAAAREAFPNVNHVTSLIGKAVPTATGGFQFTAIGYGSQLDPAGDQPTYIAIMSGTLKPSAAGNTLTATAAVSYYPAGQDQDLDGFPDTGSDGLCLTYDATLNPITLRDPCQQTKTGDSR
jgi:hypothetical protein